VLWVTDVEIWLQKAECTDTKTPEIMQLGAVGAVEIWL